MPLIREPVVAGQFYPGTKPELEKMLSGFTEKGKGENVIGVISPHAGYLYSGGVAGRTISRICKRETFVIIGPNHTGRGVAFSVFPEGVWRTPLGTLNIDNRMTHYLIQNSDLFEADETAHLYEHSVEVQLPFLQYLMKDFKIVPIVIGSMDMPDLKKAGNDIARAIKTLGGTCSIIASSDMTHYEAHDIAEKKDRIALSAISQLDEDKLAEEVAKMDISMCGVAPVIVMLCAAKHLGAKTAEIVDYKTSGDSSGDYASVVGYGGVIIK